MAESWSCPRLHRLASSILGGVLVLPDLPASLVKVTRLHLALLYVRTKAGEDMIMILALVSLIKVRLVMFASLMQDLHEAEFRLQAG